MILILDQLSVPFELNSQLIVSSVSDASFFIYPCRYQDGRENQAFLPRNIKGPTNYLPGIKLNQQIIFIYLPLYLSLPIKKRKVFSFAPHFFHPPSHHRIVSVPQERPKKIHHVKAPLMHLWVNEVFEVVFGVAITHKPRKQVGVSCYQIRMTFRHLMKRSFMSSEGAEYL